MNPKLFYRLLFSVVFALSTVALWRIEVIDRFMAGSFLIGCGAWCLVEAYLGEVE